MKNWILSMKVAVVCVTMALAASCGKQEGLPQINGISGPYINVVDGKIRVTIKFLNLQLDGGAGIIIPETHNSSLELMPNVEDGGMMLTMSIDTEELKDINIGIGDSNTLPDGRPLPGFPGGSIQNSLRIDTKVGKQDVSFYFHQKFLGLWMPFGFETAQISGYWNINVNSKNVGFLGIVGNDVANNRKAGGVLLLRLENLKNQQLQKLLELSKRNPHFIY